MMNSVQYSALTRLLTMNNRVHDLQDTLNRMPMPPLVVSSGEDDDPAVFVPNPIADLQDEVDREVRASLVTCWLGMPDPEEA